MTFSVHLLSIVSLGFHPQQEIEKVKKIFVEGVVIKVLCMSFDKFLLAVESRDLSQADKSNTRVSSFPKLCDG